MCSSDLVASLTILMFPSPLCRPTVCLSQSSIFSSTCQVGNFICRGISSQAALPTALTYPLIAQYLLLPPPDKIQGGKKSHDTRRHRLLSVPALLSSQTNTHGLPDTVSYNPLHSPADQSDGKSPVQSVPQLSCHPHKC